MRERTAHMPPVDGGPVAGGQRAFFYSYFGPVREAD